MKKAFIIITAIIAILVITSIIAFSVMSKISEDELAETVITDVDLSKISDGKYSGSCNILPVAVTVEVSVENHKITDIKIIKHNNGKGSQAEALTQKVVQAQSLKVEVISGATTSSKAILKGIENALKGGN